VAVSQVFMRIFTALRSSSLVSKSVAVAILLALLSLQAFAVSTKNLPKTYKEWLEKDVRWIISNDERDDLSVDLALFDHVESVMRPKLTGDARPRNGIGCGDVDTGTVGQDGWAGSDHGFPPPGSGDGFLLPSRRWGHSDRFDFPGT